MTMKTNEILNELYKRKNDYIMDILYFIKYISNDDTNDNDFDMDVINDIDNKVIIDYKIGLNNDDCYIIILFKDNTEIYFNVLDYHNDNPIYLITLTQLYEVNSLIETIIKNVVDNDY